MVRTEPKDGRDANGLTPDADCLHCALNAPVTAWLAEHREAKLSAVVGQVLEVAGDLGASGCATAVQLEALIRFGQGMFAEKARESFRTFAARRLHGRRLDG